MSNPLASTWIGTPSTSSSTTAPVSGLAGLRSRMSGAAEPPAENRDIEFFKQKDPEHSLEEERARGQAALAALDGCRLHSLEAPPPRPPTILKVGERRVGEAGNLLQLQGQAKSGKSAVVSAILAASIGGTGDCFGLESSNPEKKAVLHFDTEQSRCDHFDLVARAVRQRGGLHELPEHLRSYTLLTIDVKTRRLAIKEEMARAAEIHGGIHLVVIDGVADIALDPNDSEECFAIVAELHALADIHQCVIVLVLHENPNSENGKTRGHLGSQLERKAQTSIVIEKGTDEIVSMHARQARSCHWPKNEAAYFQFDKEQGMHITVADPSNRRTAKKIAEKTSKLQQLAAEVITGPMTPGELEAAIVKKEGVCDKTGRNRIKGMLKANVIERNQNGGYQPVFYDERK